jgi:hypothetical protein
MRQELKQKPINQRARTLANHLNHFRRHKVPPSWSDARTPINQAGQSVFEWPLHLYPGLERGLEALFQYRVKIDTIRKWRNGSKKPPAWAIDLLLQAIRKRIDALNHVEALLIASQKEKGPR